VDNIRTVIVGGSKPIIKYVTACVTVFNQGTQFVKLRARGQAITRAVDTVQLLRSRFMSEITIKDMQIDEDSVKRKDGQNLILPVLEILLVKPQSSF
jgi:DNA-binding protein